MTILQKLHLQNSWRGVLLGAHYNPTWPADLSFVACILSEYNCSTERLGRPKWRWKLFTPGEITAEHWKWEGDRNDLIVPEQS